MHIATAVVLAIGMCVFLSAQMEVASELYDIYLEEKCYG